MADLALSETETRHPAVILGAIREVIDRHLRIDGPSHGYDRLDELADEMETALTVWMFEQSGRLLRKDGRP